MSGNGGAPWTEAFDIILRARHEAGDSASKIAVALSAAGRRGTSRNAVIGRKNRLKLSPMAKLRHHTQEAQPTLAPKSATKSAPKPRAAKPARPVPDKAAPQAAPKVRAAKARALPADAPAPVAGITLLETLSWHCRFPSGEGPTLRFCGARALDGRSYCAHHHRIAHEPRAPRPVSNARDFSQRPSAPAGRVRDLVDMLGGGA